jgi:cysteine desulfurase/selenocysteine lyase
MGYFPIDDKEVMLLRNQTKGCQTHIHLNNAGASLPPDAVTEAIIAYLSEEAVNGGYETESKYAQKLENTYLQIADLLNANVDEVAIFENGSSAWGTAFKGVDLKHGDEIITCEMEYISNWIGFINSSKTIGVKVIVIPNDDSGNFQLDQLEKAITIKTKLIAITHISSSSGNILPIVEIGKIAEQYQIPYLLDAAQSVGQVPLDVDLIKCDMLSATGRKFIRAPRGTGFLYVRRSIQDKIRPLLLDSNGLSAVTTIDYHLRSDARRYELYEKSRALTIGLGKAIEYALNIGIDRIWQRVQYLADFTRNELVKNADVTVHDLGDYKCGIITFSVRNIESTAIKAKLAEMAINVSVSSQKATLLYMKKNKLESVVRASVHYYNTDQEIISLCKALSDIINKSYLMIKYNDDRVLKQ